MLPRVKKGQKVEYQIRGTKLYAKVFQSNLKAVWVILEGGTILKLHKKLHQIKIVEDLKEEKEETPKKKTLDDLYKLKKK